jgi:hypothetical protein
MSAKLIKILVIVSILVSLIGVALGVLMGHERNQYEAQLIATEQSLKEMPAFIQYTASFKKDLNEPAATLQKANKILRNAQQELSDKTSALEDSQNRLTSLTLEKEKTDAELATTKKESETLIDNLSETKTKLESAQGELKDINKSLKGWKAEDLFTKIDDLQSDAKNLERQNKTLGLKVAELQNKLDESEKNGFSPMTPGSLKGKIVAINKPWSFVVLDIGKENKLTEGVELNVLRDDKSIGKVRVVSVDAASAVADILPESLQSDIQIGDQVAVAAASPAPVSNP